MEGYTYCFQSNDPHGKGHIVVSPLTTVSKVWLLIFFPNGVRYELGLMENKTITLDLKLVLLDRMTVAIGHCEFCNLYTCVYPCFCIYVSIYLFILTI